MNAHKVIIHDGFEDNSALVRGDRVSLDVAMADGRRVQVTVTDDGMIALRAWPADAYITENCDAARLSFRIPTVEDMVLDGQQVSDLNFNTSAITERGLMSPDRADSCWHLANDSTQERARGIRTLLAMRRSMKTQPA